MGELLPDASPLSFTNVLFRGSKKLAEEAAWQYIRANPGIKFSLSTINPVMVYGPPLPGSRDLRHLGQSTSEIYALMNGSTTKVPLTMVPVFVDVRDVAEAHRLAFETEQPSRFLLSGGDFDMQQVCDLFRDHIPALENRVPVGSPHKPAIGEHYIADNSRARNVLGIKFRSFSETFLDMAHAFLEMEKSGESSL